MASQTKDHVSYFILHDINPCNIDPLIKQYQ